MNLKRRAFLVIGLMCLALPVASLAQKVKEDPTVRSVEGTVTDETGNILEGAVVQMKNTKNLQVRSFITQADGKYQFQGLSFGADYEFKARHDGKVSAPKTLSTFDSRKRPVINLTVEAKK